MKKHKKRHLVDETFVFFGTFSDLNRLFGQNLLHLESNRKQIRIGKIRNRGNQLKKKKT